ncbi:MAG: hypothetical protein PHR30_08485 [Gallionellaceae bacterium]|nr:hypothetical protein [Gallionellaceae bacterium]
MSKTFTVRMPAELYQAAIQAAEVGRVTVADLIRQALADRVAGTSPADLLAAVHQARDNILARLEAFEAEE